MDIFTRFFWIATNLQANSRNDICTPSLRACGAGAKALRRRQRSNPAQSRAFTLAEIMIVLTVIGVLTAILLPAARQITPDENVIKFKKAHNALLNVVHELVTSDEYYLDGDLGVRPNGALLDGKHAGDKTYLCNSMADLLNVKKVNCSEANAGKQNYHFAQSGKQYVDRYVGKYDEACKAMATTVKEEIILQDDVVFYQSAPNIPFGIIYSDEQAYRTDTGQENRCLADYVDSNGKVGADVHCPRRLFISHIDENGFYRCYKIYCIDIDGINKGEDPFGYGIRVDGKVWYDQRVKQWLDKSIQGDD